MAKSSRRNRDEEPFPEPEWPPIQELDSIDLAAKRKDGGVVLVIVASQPLDDSEETLSSIREKVRTYLAALKDKEFRAELGNPPRDKTTVVLTCDRPIHPAALTVIAQCRAAAAAQGVKLELRREMDSPP